MSQNRKHPRRGIGLIEVIACTVLVAVLVAPIALVIRASGQSIARAEGSPSIEADLRRSLRWINDAVRDGEIQKLTGSSLTVRLSNGTDVVFSVGGGSLLMDDGTTPVVLAENASEVQFRNIKRNEKPKLDVGVSIRLRAIDPVTGLVIEVNSTIAIPPQA